MNSIFTEVPVMQISCNLEPCRLNKIIIINCPLPVWGRHSQNGKQEIYLEWTKVELQCNNYLWYITVPNFNISVLYCIVSVKQTNHVKEWWHHNHSIFKLYSAGVVFFSHQLWICSLNQVCYLQDPSLVYTYSTYRLCACVGMVHESMRFSAYSPPIL